MTTNQSETELMVILSEIATCLNEIRGYPLSQTETDFLTVKEASKYLNVSDSLLRKWLFKNQIKPHRFGRCIRFNKHELSQWANNK